MAKKFLIAIVCVVVVIAAYSKYRLSVCDGDITCSNLLPKDIGKPIPLLFGFQSLVKKTTALSTLFKDSKSYKIENERDLGFLYAMEFRNYCFGNVCGTLSLRFYQDKLGEVRFETPHDAKDVISRLMSEGQFDPSINRKAFYSIDPGGQTKIWAHDTRLISLIEAKENY